MREAELREHLKARMEAGVNSHVAATVRENRHDAALWLGYSRGCQAALEWLDAHPAPQPDPFWAMVASGGPPREPTQEQRDA